MSPFEASDIAREQACGAVGALHTGSIGSLEPTNSANPPAGGPSASSVTAQALSRLEEVMAGLGGELVVHSNGEGIVDFSVRFRSSPTLVQRIEALLCSHLPPAAPDQAPMDDPDDRAAEVGRILQTTKRFMQAFCQGDLERCREVMRQVVDQQNDQKLFHEIGQLAREFHTSLSQLTETLDPAFRVIVEERLPDSGSRLEHILEITENAANTTLDKVEAMQARNEEDHSHVKQIQGILDALTALGPEAASRLSEATAVTDALATSIRQTRDDLVSILMAQDFQDLTGQIIQRVLTLLKDLETKLVNMVKVFGVRSESAAASQEALYGPAHKGKHDALHCQNDVDSLLADFGF